MSDPLGQYTWSAWRTDRGSAFELKPGAVLHLVYDMATMARFGVSDVRNDAHDTELCDILDIGKDYCVVRLKVYLRAFSPFVLRWRIAVTPKSTSFDLLAAIAAGNRPADMAGSKHDKRRVPECQPT